MPTRGTPLKNVGEKLKFSVVEDGYCTVSVFFRYTSIGIGKDEVRLLRVKYHIFIVNDDVSGIRLGIVCKPRCNFHPFAVSHSRINVRKIGSKQPFITDRRWSDVYHTARKMPLLPHLLHGFQPKYFHDDSTTISAWVASMIRCNCLTEAGSKNAPCLSCQGLP